MSRPTISSLNSSNNFQTWFNTTNSLITEVNFLNSTGITGITGSNGIGVTTDGDRNYTVRFNGNVSSTVTLSGHVTFLSTLNASSINVSSTKLSYSPKVSGLTAGNVVRIDSSVGLTFAKADSAANAEVLGIVVGEDTTYNYIAVSGQVDNSVFANTIKNALGIVGATLGKGAAYFLSPTVAGGLTTIEPTAYGQVSKPMLLGITGDKGLILPYRGIVLEGTTAGITAELDNKIIIEIDYTATEALGMTNGSNIGSPTPIKIGDPVFYATNGKSIDYGPGYDTAISVLNLLTDHSDPTSVGNCSVKLAGLGSNNEIGYWIVDWYNVYSHSIFNGDTGYWKYFMGSETVESGRILGLVSSIIATPASLGQKKYILEVTLPGGSFKVNNFNTDLDTTLYPTSLGLTAGSYCWSPYNVSSGATNPYTNNAEDWRYGWPMLFHESILPRQNNQTEIYKFLDVIKTSATSGTIIFHYKTTRQVISAEYNENDFAVTAFTPTTASSGITGGAFYNYLPNGAFTVWQRPFSGLTAGQLTSFLTPVADRWFWTNYGVTGLTLSLSRSQFNSNQTEVPGSPLYYVNINTQYSLPLADPTYAPRLENIQKNARLLQGQTATLSFYAKSTVSGATLNLTFSRYPEGIQEDDGLFELAMEGRQTIVSGITLTGSWAKYSQTFVVPVMGYTLTTQQDGWIAFGFEFPRSSATLSIAQVILEQGYGSKMVGYINPQDELQRCKPYYQRSYDIDEAPRSTNFRGNEQVIQLGNLNGQSIYSVKFPSKMIETPGSVITYSPVTGTPTEAYNVNAGKDLRYTTGTLIGYPWDTTPKYRQGAGLTGNITIPNSSQYGFDIQLNSGAVSFDTIKFHWIADSDILYRG